MVSSRKKKQEQVTNESRKWINTRKTLTTLHLWRNL